MSKETHLPMYLSSSAVNQLTTLYLYFQYWAKADNNFLMVDEPEENLHPRNQIALCNALLKFVKHNNNRVLINTHSPLIAENINNYLYLHILKAQYGLNIEDILADNELKLRTDITISPEELGVYFFNGIELISYEAEDYGVYFRDFQKVNDEI
jgi:predicted ATPase